MKIINLTLTLVFLFTLFSSESYSQLWSGSTSTTGLISRSGNVSIKQTPGSAIMPTIPNDYQFLVYSHSQKYAMRAYCGSNTNFGINAYAKNPNTIAFSVTKEQSLYTTGSPPTFTPSNDESFVVLGDGRVFATELTIKKFPVFPDYVFNTDYNLLSLYQIENYIKLNHRLPNIPSAEEVAKKGLSVGTMQVLQMEKIEELTLHMISLKKENDALKKQNDKLQADMDLIKEKLGMTK